MTSSRRADEILHGQEFRDAGQIEIRADGLPRDRMPVGPGTARTNSASTRTATVFRQCVAKESSPS
jgi:hypothetical protein